MNELNSYKSSKLPDLSTDATEMRRYYQSLVEFKKVIQNINSHELILAELKEFFKNITLFGRALLPQVLKDIEYLSDLYPANHSQHERFMAMIQIVLEQQIDYIWYSAFPLYSEKILETDLHLYDFSSKNSQVTILFNFTHLRKTLIRKIPNSLRIRTHRLINHPAGNSEGLTVTKSKLATIAFINHFVEQVNAQLQPAKILKPYVNSVLRTIEYQKSLAQRGYIAPEISAHQAGYAFDLERKWYYANDTQAYECMNRIVWSYFDAGQINVLDEGTHWHVSLNPKVIEYYESIGKKWLINTK